LTTIHLTGARPRILPRLGALRRNDLPRRRRVFRRPSAPNLPASKEARSLSTPFKRDVLRTIYDIARSELGHALYSATISTWEMQGEPGPPILLLSARAKVRRADIERVRTTILETIATHAASWSKSQREDYRSIYFDIESDQK